MKRFVVLMSLVAVIGLVATSALAQSFTATLNGSQEVPANGSPGIGAMTGTLSGGPGAWTFIYSGSFSGLTAPVNAQPSGGHIHNAPVGINGGVVHPLVNLDTGVTAGNFSGTWNTASGLTDTLVGEMLAGRLYVNIHTSAFSGGEIRGQIVPEPASIGLLLAGSTLMLRRRR